MKRSIMRTFVMLPVLVVVGSVNGADAPKRYNIITILTDDQEE